MTEDPVFQRQVIGCQLVPRSISPESGSKNYKTIGGRTVVVRKDEAGTIMVNDVPVQEVVMVEDTEVWVLSKLLFIRPEDMELAVGRVRGM